MARKVKWLKYAKEHLKCGSSCTASKWKEKTFGKAFRLVVNEISRRSDFLPPAIENPRRQFATKPTSCRAFALSLFTTMKKVKRHRDLVAQTSKYFENKLRYASETSVGTSDGRVSPVNSDGHFGLHEYLNNSLLENAQKAVKIAS